MGRVIRGQVIASTAVDSHGEQISPEAIESLFRQVQEPWLTYCDHDTSVAPVCRGYNKRLEKRANGELAIVLDLEVLNEEAFAQRGGFSIAFTNRTMRFGDSPAVRILINPRQFGFEQVAYDMGRLLPHGQGIDVTERVEKAAILEGAIIVVAFVIGGIAKGFFSKAGGELYDYLKKLRTGTPPKEPTLHLHATLTVLQKPIVLLLVADPATSAWDLAAVDFDALATTVEAMPGVEEIQRVVGVIHPGPTVELRFMVRADGNTLSIR